MGRQGTWVVPGPSGILDRCLWGGHLRTDERRLVPPFPGTPALGDPLPTQSRGPHTHFLCPEPLPQPLLSGQCYRCSHFCDSSTGSAPWWEGRQCPQQWPTRLPPLLRFLLVVFGHNVESFCLVCSFPHSTVLVPVHHI